MLKDRPIIRFVLLFTSIYVGFLLVNETSFFRKAHYEFYASFGGWVYNSWHPRLHVDIDTDVTSKGADPSNDYLLTACDKREYKSVIVHNARNPMNPKGFQPVSLMSFKARMSHSIATFFLLSLVFATPNKWLRKMIGAILGLYLLYIIVAMKLTFLLEMADGSKTKSDGTWYLFSNIVGNNKTYQELSFIFTLAIWILVSISKESMQAMTSSVKSI